MLLVVSYIVSHYIHKGETVQLYQVYGCMVIGLYIVLMDACVGDAYRGCIGRLNVGDGT